MPDGTGQTGGSPAVTTAPDGTVTLHVTIHAIEEDFSELEPDCVEEPCPNANGVGEPGLLEGMIPVWGSGRAAVNDFQNGRWGWGLFNTAMAVSDVFLVKALVVGVGKAVVRGAAKEVVEQGGKQVVKEGVEQAEKSAMTKAERLAANKAQGAAREAAVKRELEAQGHEVFEQVTVKTSKTNRRIDLLVRDGKTGELRAVEVKSGNATRNATQLAKDQAMETEGAKIIGKNAPDGLRGQTIKIPTTEVN